jgi:hypothetical protein
MSAWAPFCRRIRLHRRAGNAGDPLRALAAAALLALAGSEAAAAAEGAVESLRARHAALAEKLRHSPFGQPLVIESSAGEGELIGEVHAVVEHPFTGLAGALQAPAAWCEVLILVVNVKQCRPDGDGLKVHLGRTDDEDLEGMHEIRFAFRQTARSAEHLGVRLAAEHGPLGTHDYAVEFAAVSLPGGRHSFIHMRYAYRYGLAARLALQGYLSTFARDKVGFSPAGPGADAQPVAGLRGLIERNTMRYYLAITAFLGAREAPPAERLERRLRAWFAAVERYPRQLGEDMDEAEYLEMKRRQARHPQAGAAPAAPG